METQDIKNMGLAYLQVLEAQKLSAKQQKLDVVDDEKIDAKDFAKLRKMKEEDESCETGETKAHEKAEKKKEMKLTKEEAELVSELSKKTLNSYNNKASDSIRKNIWKSEGGLKLSDKEKRDDRKRSKGMDNADAKLSGYAKINAKEEVELDELSKKTLGSYGSKARRSLGTEKDRSKGINMASAKLYPDQYKNSPLKAKVAANEEDRSKGLNPDQYKELRMKQLRAELKKEIEQHVRQYSKDGEKMKSGLHSTAKAAGVKESLVLDLDEAKMSHFVYQRNVPAYQEVVHRGTEESSKEWIKKNAKHFTHKGKDFDIYKGTYPKVKLSDRLDFKHVAEEVEAGLEESITKMSNARLKFHATKDFPHGSYSNAEIKDEHKRRMKVEPNYHTVKPSLSEEIQIDELSKKTLGSYASTALNRGDIAARMSKSDDSEMGKIAKKRLDGAKLAVKKLGAKVGDKATATRTSTNIDKAKAAGRNYSNRTGNDDEGKSYYAAGKGINKLRDKSVKEETAQKWVILNRIQEKSGDRADHVKGATAPEALNSKDSQKAKEFAAMSGVPATAAVDANVIAQQTADAIKASADKIGGNSNRPNDQKTGDKNIVK